MFSDEIKTFRCDHNSWRWERYVGEERRGEGDREGSVGGKRGGRGENVGESERYNLGTVTFM